MILDGKLVKKLILEELREKVFELERKPGLAIILVGNNEAGEVYIRQKEKMASYLGYVFEILRFKDDVLQEDIISIIDELNNRDDIDGIMVQMPLPKHLDSELIQNRIMAVKDVDGLSLENVNRLKNKEKGLIPCTAIGVIDLLDYYNIDVFGKRVVIVGKSKLVGQPLYQLFLQKGAEVLICDSKTNNLSLITKQADILVVAVGKAKLISREMIKSNAIVIDVGINLEDGKLVGDVDYEMVADKCYYITPVPGGVGPMTVAELGKNTYLAYLFRKNN